MHPVLTPRRHVRARPARMVDGAQRVVRRRARGVAAEALPDEARVGGLQRHAARPDAPGAFGEVGLPDGAVGKVVGAKGRGGDITGDAAVLRRPNQRALVTGAPLGYRALKEGGEASGRCEDAARTHVTPARLPPPYPPSPGPHSAPSMTRWAREYAYHEYIYVQATSSIYVYTSSR